MDAFTTQAAEIYQSGKSLAEVAAAMHTSANVVSRRFRASGIEVRYGKKAYWTPEEDAIISEHYMLMDDELATLIGTRSKSAVANRRKTLGLEKYPERSPKKWTDDDFKFIEANTDMTTYALSKHFGVRESSISCIRSRKGMHRKYFCRVCGVGISQQGEFCKDHRHIGRQMCSYTSKAMVKGREFALSTDHTYKLLTSDCTYCGGPGYGIDRIDSSKGYIEGNVTPCCSRCNIMKNNMTVAEFEVHIRRIAAHLKEKA